VKTRTNVVNKLQKLISFDGTSHSYRISVQIQKAKKAHMNHERNKSVSS